MKAKSKFYLKRPGLSLVFTLVLSQCPQVRAADGTWTTDDSSTWSNSANWSGGVVADGMDFAADFGSADITGLRTVSLDSARSISNLSFGDAEPSSSGSWVLNNHSEPANILTLAATSGLSTITVNAGTSADISAVLAGADGFTKAGNGLLVLSGNNTYTGTTRIYGGTLAISGAGTLGSSSALDIQGYRDGYYGFAFLDLGGTTQSVGAVSLVNGSAENGKLLGSSYSLANAEVAADLGGVGVNLTSDGYYSVLSGTNTYTGTTTINSESSLQFAKAASLYNSDSSKWTKDNITVANNAMLAIRMGGVGEFSVAQGKTLLANLTNSVNNNGLQAGAAFAIDTGNATGDTTFDQVIADSTGVGGGSLGFTKLGSGKLILNQANTYTGRTTIQGGTLQIGKVASLYNASNYGSSLWTKENISVDSGAMLAVNVGSYDEFSAYSAGILLGNLTGSVNNNGLQAGSCFGIDTSNATSDTAFSHSIANSTGTGGGALSFAKLGTGTLVLSGANSYSGATSIQGGTLEFRNAASLYNSDSAKWTNSNISVASGATLAVQVGRYYDNSIYNTQDGFTAAQAKTLLSNLSTNVNHNGLQAGSTFAIDTYNNVTFDQKIADSTGAGGGALGFTKLGYGRLTLNQANTYTGPTTLSGGTLVIAGAGTLGSHSALTLNDYSSLNLGGTTQTVGAVVLNGNSRQRVSNGNLVATSYNDAINENNYSYFSSPTEIAAGLGGIGASYSKSGTGRTILSGINTYTGTSSISAGTLEFDKTSSLYNGTESSWTKGNISVAGGATLAVGVGGAGQFTVAQAKGLLSALSNSIDHNGLQAGANFGIDISDSVPATFDQVIADSTGAGAGALGLTKLGYGRLTLNQANTYSGPTRIYGGTLAISGAGTLGSNSALDIYGYRYDYAGSALLDLGGTTQSVGAVSLSNGSIENGKLMGSSYSLSNAVVAADLGGVGVNLTTDGSYAVLSGTNTYTGTTTINSGSLQFAKAASFYNSDSSKWTKDNITVANSATLAISVGGAGEFSVAQGKTLLANLTNSINNNGLQAGSTFAIDTGSATGDITFDQVIADSTGVGGGALGFTKSGYETKLILNQANTYTGRTTIDSGTLAISGAGKIGNNAELLINYAGSLDLGGTSQAAAAVTLNGGSIANGSLVGTSYDLRSGTVTAGLGGLGVNLETGYGNSFGGEVTLSGTNTYTGTTTIYAAATLHVEKVASLYNGDTSQWTKEKISASGDSYSQGTLALNVGGIGEFSIAQAKTLLGNLTTGIDFNGLQAGSSFGIDTSHATGDTTFDGVIADSTGNGSGSLGLTKLGDNALVLNQANTYTGDTTISGGTLKVGLANALPSGNGKGNVILTGGILDLNGFNVSINGLGDSNYYSYGSVVNNSAGTDKILTLGNGNADGLFAGTIADNSGEGGTLGLQKVGSGTQTLSNYNSYSYTGATTVTGGTLVVNGDISSSINTTVSNLAILKGSGRVGALTVTVGGTLAPGNSPGILNTGNLTIDGTFAAEINGTEVGTTYDQLNVTGSVTLGGVLAVTMSGYTPALGSMFFVIANDGDDAVNGNFTGLAQGAQFDRDGQRWSISYHADSVGKTFNGGNDVALMAMAAAVVPEPSAALLSGLGLLALLRRRRS